MAEKKEYIKSFIIRLIVFIFIMLIMFTQIFGFYAIQNNEMQPKLMAGDLTLFYRIGSKYRSSNVVVYKAKGKKHVGRIIAVPGDTVEIDGKVYVLYTLVKPYGHAIEAGTFTDPNRVAQTINSVREFTDPSAKLKLNINDVVLCLPPYEGAKDSRYFGPVSKKNILGEVITAIRRGNL